MNLIIINGPSMSGKTKLCQELENLIEKSGRKALIPCRESSIEGIKSATKFYKPDYFIIDDSKDFNIVSLFYLTSIAKEIYTFTLKRKPIDCGTIIFTSPFPKGFEKSGRKTK